MELAVKLASIFFTMILVDNYVLAKFLGICPFLGVSKKLDSSVAMLLFCGVRQRVESSNPPESFKGLPITLVSAAITSMSFMGFGGLVENIINALL